MESGARCRRLADKIREVLQRGVHLSPETLHYIESTFSRPCAETLGAFLVDPSDGDAESLCSLLFFPDTLFQLQIEPILESERFRIDDPAQVVRLLMDAPPHVPLFSPDHRKLLTAVLPACAVEPLVSRLRITQSIDATLLAHIHRHLAQDRQVRAKVALRNARVAATPGRIRFLCAFFEKVREPDDACLDFILALLEAGADPADYYKTLIDRKRSCFHNLQKARRFYAMLEKDNMETLMMRGIRIPHIDSEQLYGEMRIIDRICLAIFGKTEYFHPPEQVLGTGGFAIGETDETGAPTHFGGSG